MTDPGRPSPDPSPPDRPAGRAPARPATPRPGQLTTAWQIMVAISWAAAFFALAGVWKASEEVGIATWWLGPRADPQPIFVQILPFAVTVVVALGAVYNLHIVTWLSLAGSAAIAVIATVDLAYMTELALAEFAIAGAVAVVSAAAFAGRYRAPVDGTPTSAADRAPEPAVTAPTAAGPPTGG